MTLSFANARLRSRQVPRNEGVCAPHSARGHIHLRCLRTRAPGTIHVMSQRSPLMFKKSQLCVLALLGVAALQACAAAAPPNGGGGDDDVGGQTNANGGGSTAAAGALSSNGGNANPGSGGGANPGSGGSV